MAYETSEYKRILSATESIRRVTDEKPEIALVLGSGLGHFADRIEVSARIKYSDIEGFPTSGVAGHKGELVFGKAFGKSLVIMQGRVHLYEGYSAFDVTLPIRVMKLLGAEKLILTNAAGGINPELKCGGLLLITDHISTFVPSPIRGANIDELGERFPDMSEVYSKALAAKAKEKAKELSVDLKEGVYIQLPGPAYETPAEIRMCKALGADVVGMSTACEALAAKHMGMEILGISCVTNMAAGLSECRLCHDEVKAAARAVADDFSKLLLEIIKEI
jgi:purine-nucleoside phosphorylase